MSHLLNIVVRDERGGGGNECRKRRMVCRDGWRVLEKVGECVRRLESVGDSW